MTPEQKKEISKLRVQGLGYQKIATALGLTKNQVVSYCHRNGLDGKIADPSGTVPDAIFCKNCGKVYDLFDLEAPTINGVQNIEGHMVDEVQLYYKGICEHCMESKKFD